MQVTRNALTCLIGLVASGSVMLALSFEPVAGTTLAVQKARFAGLATGLVWQGSSSESDWLEVSQESARAYSYRRVWAAVTLTSIHGAADGSRLWAVGERGTILHTANGGKTWAEQARATQDLLYSIHSLDDGLLVWAVGESGTILHSGDGGLNWGEQVSGTGAVLHSIHGTDDGLRLWTVGDLGTILHSADGGRTWVTQSSGTEVALGSVHSSGDGLRVWAVGEFGTILHSGDGGLNWGEQVSGTGAVLHAIHGTDDGLRLWTVGDFGTIQHTADGGQTWVAQASGTREGLSSIHGSDDERWAVGEWGTVLHSADGSWTWEAKPTDQVLSSIHGTDNGSQLWAVGENGTIVYSANEGESWVPQTGTGIRSIHGTEDGSEVWAVGKRGTIMHSRDAGEVWGLQATRSRTLTSIHGTDDGSRLWAVGLNGEIVLSANGGRTWGRRHGGTSRTLLSVFGVGDGSRLWAVGSGGEILHSADGGTAWIAQASGTGVVLTSIHGSDDGSRLWAVGGNGTILHSADGGQTWVAQTCETFELLTSIFSTDDGSQIWVVGEEGTILHSGDGGRSWSLNFRVGMRLNSVCGTNGGSGIWAAAENGTVFHSADGGLVWNNLRWHSESPVRSIYATDDGSRVLAAHESGAIGVLTPSGVYPGVAKWRVLNVLGGVRLELRWRNAKGAVSDDSPFSIVIRGQSAFGHSRQYPVQTISVDDVTRDSSASTHVFDVGEELNVSPGESVRLSVQTTCNGFRQVFPLGEFVFDRWAWWRENARWLTVVAILVAIPLLLLALWRVRPLFLIQLYRYTTLFELAQGLGWWAAPLRLCLTMTLVPALATSRRSLDAWVAHHLCTVRVIWGKEQTVQRSRGYVPLPVRASKANVDGVVHRPEPATFAPFFQKSRAVELIGPGGSGKTTLAVQIGWWALAGSTGAPVPGLSRHAMIPVLVDEDTDDLFGVVKRKLQAWLGVSLEDELLDALLEKRRILVLVERLSERRPETREHVRTVHASHPFHALLVTSRVPTYFECGDSVTVSLLPFDSETLLFFMTNLLAAAEKQVFTRIEEQLQLGTELSRLIRLENHEVAVTPLLVRLYVDKAVRLAEHGVSLAELPDSIPEVCFDYVRTVNPHGDDLVNETPDEIVLEAAEAIARLCIGDKYVPGEVTKAEAMAELACLGLEAPGPTIDRLVENGILTHHTVGSDTFVRFGLDPIAEYLAASAWAKACGTDRLKWSTLEKQLRDMGETAEGFRIALELTYQAYKGQYGWKRDGTGESSP